MTIYNQTYQNEMPSDLEEKVSEKLNESISHLRDALAS